MSDEQANSTPHKSGEKKEDIPATTEYVDEATDQEPQTGAEKNDNPQIQKEPIQVIVNIPKEEYKAAITANKIAIAGLLINLILGVFTYLLFRTTTEANKTSSAALAQASKANNISERLFNFSQEQFQKQNEPYLEIIDAKIDTPYILYRPLRISFTVANLGNYPVKISNAIAYSHLTFIQDTIPSFFKLIQKAGRYVEIENRYIVKDANLAAKYEGELVGSANLNDLQVSNYDIYFTGAFTFDNLITKTKKIYHFEIKFGIRNMPYGRQDFQFIYNENEPFKK